MHARIPLAQWESYPELLGSDIYIVPNSAVANTFPYECSAGILGSDDPQYQTSPSARA